MSRDGKPPTVSPARRTTDNKMEGREISLPFLFIKYLDVLRLIFGKMILTYVFIYDIIGM
jgi:hypothetical protein